MPFMHLSIPIFIGIFYAVPVPDCMTIPEDLDKLKLDHRSDAWYVDRNKHDFTVSLFSYNQDLVSKFSMIELNRDQSAGYKWLSADSGQKCLTNAQGSFLVSLRTRIESHGSMLVFTGTLNNQTNCFVNQYIKAPPLGIYNITTTYPGSGTLKAHWWLSFARRVKRSISFCPSVGIDIGISIGVAMCNSGDISEEVSHLVKENYDAVKYKINMVESKTLDSVSKQNELLKLQQEKLARLTSIVAESSSASKEFEKNFDKFLNSVHNAWEKQDEINDYLADDIQELMWRTIRAETINSIRIMKNEWMIRAQTQSETTCKIELSEYNLGSYPLMLLRKLIGNHIQINDLMSSNHQWLQISHRVTEEIVNVSQSTLRIENGSLVLFNQTHNATRELIKQLNEVINEDSNYLINSLKYRKVEAYLGVPTILKGLIALTASVFIMIYPSYMPLVVSGLLSMVGLDFIITGTYSFIKGLWMWL